jgi:pyridoxine kinase
LVRSRVRSSSALSLFVSHLIISVHRILTQIPLVSLPSVREALIKLHKEFRVPYVAISSIPLKDWLEEALPEDIRPSSASASGSWLLCITSECDISELKSNGEVTSIVHAQCVPFLPGYFSGVGDLFSALVLAHYHPKPPSSSFSPALGTPFSSAVSHALSKTHSVLLNTYHYSEGLPEDERLATDDEKDEKDPIRKVRRMRGRELRLIQSADVIRANLDEIEKEGQVEGNERKKKGGVEIEMRRLVKWNEFWGSS